MKEGNETGVSQRLALSLYRAASETVEWGLPVVSCGKVDGLSLDYLA